MTKLDQLRVDYDARLKDAEAALDGETPDLEKAAELEAEAKGLLDQIDAITDAAAQAEVARARIAEQKAAAAQVKRLPFGNAGGTGRVEAGESEIDKKAMSGGFQSAGHFVHSLFKSGRRNDGDPSAVKAIGDWADLQRKAPSGMFEASDPDGGILVPPQYSNKIYERMVTPFNLLNYVPKIPVTGNTLVLPALLENSRANGSRHGGIQAYWEGEADQLAYTRPKFRKLELKLSKLAVLSAVTNELLEDSMVALDAWLGNVVPKEFAFKITDAMINGNGVGMPKGILVSGSKITTSAVASQGAATLVYANTVAMFGRMLASQRGSAIWLYNQEVEPQLLTLYHATGTANGYPVFQPNSSSPTGFSLWGRPALPCEQCAALGTEGDVIFVDPTDIACITKGTVNSQMSIHLRFDYDESVFRWTFRMDSQPYNDVALTAFKGSNTYSSIVTLSSTRT
jgi:HK97 family phage major capsid protein